jgi:glycosidase
MVVQVPYLCLLKDTTHSFMNLSNRILLGLTLALICNVLSAQIYHVEPPNWWTGMKNQNLQLLVHGNAVNETTPVINYPGVVIQNVHEAESKNYLFIDLYISTTAKPGAFSIFFVKEGDTLYTQKYTLLARDQNVPVKGFNSSDVIYLLNPDRFVNGDITNDVVPVMKEQKVDRKEPMARHGGDIRGIINSLDYISKMGFTAIWPTPLLENDMPKASYHGYAITNHYKVDPRFGTLNDYKELATKSREKGLKLIFDGVLNHTGTGYWWTNDLPFKDWINYTGPYVRTNDRRTTHQDIYASAYDKDLMTHGWFDNTMADMNGQNPYMANYLIQNTIWWIETLHLSGLRQDTYPYSDKDFLKKWSCSVMEEYPDFTIVGEESSLNPLISSYWQKGKVNYDGYDGCLPSIMDFALQSSLVGALKTKDSTSYTYGLIGLYEALANDFVYADPKNIMVFGDNHDMDRLYTQLGKDVDLTRMALTYLLTVRGIPQIYYGSEVLMDNSAALGNDGVRRSDFPGGWKGDPVNAFTGLGLSADQKNMQAYLKQLLNWRKNNPVVATGQTLHFAPFDGVYVYFRYNTEKTVMVVMNKNKGDTTIDLKRFAEILANKSKAENALTGEIISGLTSLTVKGKTTSIFNVN